MKQYQSFMGWLLFCLHLFLFHFPSFTFSSFNFLCHHDESSSLLQFKSSFKTETDNINFCEPLLKTATWKNGTDCCSWHGVTCDTISGNVVGLNLGCEGFLGTLYSNSTLFHLTHLQKLNLSHNYFIDSHFHFKFGRLLSLTHLDLSWCDFYGEVPPQISHLSKLESLHLASNFRLVWKETTLKRLVQNATNLRKLFLKETDMSSIRPNSIDLIFNQSSSLVNLNLQNTFLSGKFKKNILCLPSIQELDLSYNDKLEGQLPELSCSSTSLRILDLSECQFKGPIPQSYSNFTHLTLLNIYSNNINGSISSSLLTLPRLTYLILGDNELSGQIPNVFPQSNSFQYLDLSNNKIGGEIPSSLSNLQLLVGLSLSNNSFNGQIPDVFRRMTKLESLQLDSNHLEGQVPSSLFTLTQLVTLDCSHNKLEGPLFNKFLKFQKLTDLRLNENFLNGTIPPSLLSLPSLEYLYLTNNRFTGHISAISSYSLLHLDLGSNKLQGNIPESIFNLANLTYLDLSSNNLSGVINFQHFSKLQNLFSLSLSHNSQLSLKFESNVDYKFSRLWKLHLSSMSLTEFPKLSGETLDSIDLSNNKLSGRVPNWLLETVDSLATLNLSRNLFTSIGQISRNYERLRGLDLSFNLLDGDLPVSICNMSSLEILNLAHNKLTGIIPQCLANLSSLRVLDLQMNRFYGSLPSNFSESGELKTLNLNGNQLAGHFPKSLSGCRNLEFLNLGSNKIEGYFPVWLQTLKYLKVLVLRDNKLHGIIANLRTKHSFPSLIIFDISGNNFSGPLPNLKKFEAMKNATELEYMVNSLQRTNWNPNSPETIWYNVSMIVATKGIKMALVKIPTILVIIDLSRNNFEGEIPNVIGELHALIGLNLSHNSLTGLIPQSMGNLTKLESLDLASNMFTGVIPAELTNLDSLEVLDLSDNHLAGEIPQGKQFNTFTNDSYEGNSALCGFPLSRKCGPEPEQHHSAPSANKFWSEEKFGFGWKPVAIGYGCGFVIGIGLGYFLFLIGKPRWLVMIFGGQPKRRVNRRRTRVRRTNGSTQMVQMSVSFLLLFSLLCLVTFNFLYCTSVILGCKFVL